MPLIKEAIRTLGETVRQIVTEAVSTNKVVPGGYRAVQWKLEGFKYDDSGVTVSNPRREDVIQKTWFRTKEILEPQIKSHDSYKKVVSAIQESYPALQSAELLDSLLGALISLSLPGGDGSKAEDVAKRFLNDLEGGPVTHTARVSLEGVTLQPQTIEVETGIRIRKPQREELETPNLADFAEPFPRYPSAIVEIESPGARERSPQLLQLKVEQSVALLRLFSVGSVKWMHYEMGCDSIVQRWPTGRLTSGDKNPAPEKYVIKTGDEPSLKRFWQTMSARLPTGIYDFQRQINHLTLAYDRYSDALLLNGLVERRIANVIMGLEALFLKENQELSYRLSVRISKLLSLVRSRNPLEIRSTLMDAYEIRSTFAHGGHISDGKKRRLERKYSSIKALLLTLLDYLRVSIVAAITCAMSKDALINLVDNALLDAPEHERLKRLLSDTAVLLS